MPTYQYACTECDHTFEAVQSFSDDSLTVCPSCDGRLRKIFNAVGVVFKGSGFYRTDNRPSDGTANGTGNGTGSDTKSKSSSANGSSSNGTSDSGSSGTGSSDSSTGPAPAAKPKADSTSAA